MPKTVQSVLESLRAGTQSAAGLLASCIEQFERIDGEGGRVFPFGISAAAHHQARASDASRSVGVELPLSGVPVSIKDLFDVQGEVTRSGSKVLNKGCAQRDAAAIANLRAAGAVFVGRTNMTEFAYSGVGINPHYGTPRNPYRRHESRIPGGSSSGAAVSVADAMAVAAIGSDTGGSCRIPAALCGLTGFKPTARRISLQGAVPLSPSYDSIGSIASSVACCATLDAVMAGSAPRPLRDVPLRGLRLAIPRDAMSGLDQQVSHAFGRAIDALVEAGVTITQIRPQSWERLGELSAAGGLVAAEASAWHRQLLAQHEQDYDPRVVSRIRLAAPQRADDYVQMVGTRAELCTLASDELAAVDAWIMPTVPIVAPRIADLEDDEEFFRVNRLLLRNPSSANMLDLCSLSIPCHADDDPPAGLMLHGRHMDDHRLLEIGAAIERHVAKIRGVKH
jgi:aspartyl-tRNA(Asn)/glutamyl-tRNA(Gln) amidotransferase subunit A